MDKYIDDLKRPGSPLAPVAIALIEYAVKLTGGKLTFVLKENDWWQSDPNIIRFKIPRIPRYVDFSIWGYAFPKCKALRLEPYTGYYRSYYKFRLENPRQLGAASSYIATAINCLQYKRKKIQPIHPPLAEIL